MSKIDPAETSHSLDQARMIVETNGAEQIQDITLNSLAPLLEKISNNLATIAQNLPPTSDAPPKVLVYLTLTLTVGHLLWRFVVFAVDRWDRRRDSAKKIRHDYWIDKLILPVCVDPLLKFSIEQSSKIERLSNDGGANEDDFSNFLNQFKTEKESVSGKFILLANIDISAHDSIQEMLDTLEDEISLYCAVKGSVIAVDDNFIISSPPRRIYKSVTDIFNKIVSLGDGACSSKK